MRAKSFKKTYLLTPGPTPIPEEVVAESARPLVHHRTPDFERIFEEVRDGLKYVFQTKQEVITLAATGTGAMDSAVCNLFCKGDKVITVNGGKFGDRWGKISKAYGLEVVEIWLERGDSVEASHVEKTIQENQDAKAVLFQASETSTGAAMPVKEIVDLCRQNNMLSVVDGITAVGVMDLPMDEWGIDVLMSGSQKAFMIPPGLAFIALSDRAWKAAETSDLPHFYFDLKKEHQSVQKNQSAWTPAINLLQALNASLKMIREEGLENVFARHQLLANATRNAVQALGLETLATRAPSMAVTSVKVPASVTEGKKIPKLMREKYGVTIAGGQDDLAGKIFRLSHFGHAGAFDITTGISALEIVLSELGHSVEFGKGVGAALKTIVEG